MRNLVLAILITIVCSSYSLAQTVVQDLQDISVGIRANQSEGSGVVINRTLKDGKQVTLCLSAAHVVSGLQKTYNKDVTFDDALLVKQIVDNGRKVGELTLNAKILKYSDPDKEDDLVLMLVRKPDYFTKSTNFYLQEEIPSVGRELYHVGNMLGSELGLNSLTKGIISQNGRVIQDKTFDQFSGGSTSGSSGGGMFIAETGEYCGQLQRGAVNVPVMGYYAPIRRIKDWAKREKLMWVLDQNSPDLPTFEELNNIKVLSDRMIDAKKETGGPVLKVTTDELKLIDVMPFLQ